MQCHRALSQGGLSSKTLVHLMRALVSYGSVAALEEGQYEFRITSVSDANNYADGPARERCGNFETVHLKKATMFLRYLEGMKSQLDTVKVEPHLIRRRLTIRLQQSRTTHAHVHMVALSSSSTNSLASAPDAAAGGVVYTIYVYTPPILDYPGYAS